MSIDFRIARIISSVMFVLTLSVIGMAQVIYDNGTLSSGGTTRSGVAAPAGATWSEAQNDNGVTNYANTSAGSSCSVTATVFRCADDFNVPVGQTWTVSQVVVFAYQTGFAGGTSPITAATLQIWRGRPGDPGSVLVFGDTSTNRLGTSTNANVFRIFNTVVGAGANPPTAPGTTRIVWQNNLNVSPAAVLTAGNYWIDWNTQIGATTAHFAPVTTILGSRNAPLLNARQFTGAAWVDVVDAGQTPTGNPTPIPMPMDFPFKLNGSIAGAPLVPASRTVDMNGDNKTDFVVARSTDAVSQSTWWTQLNGGAITGSAFGLGVGFAAGDRPTPADFDGDGKSDIAVWRPGAALTASYFILNSATSTVSIVPFGQTGDDVSVVDDFDGDGKADPACYRAGASVVLYYRGSLSNPGGNITFNPWGGTGDIAIPGDYDGDGKADISVIKAVSGAAQHWRKLSGGGTSVVDFGLLTDKFVTGDFDADGRTDVAAVRVNGTNYDWFIFKSGTASIAIEKYGNPTTDFIVPGDYDGDNKIDLAVWRSGAGGDSGNFFVRNTFGPPIQLKWGNSSTSLSAPDFPVATFSVK